MTTFTARESVTVTIPPATFAADAERDFRKATHLHAEAVGNLALARVRAANAPADFHTVGGADAATVVRFIEDDVDDLLRSAEGAGRAFEQAKAADTAQHAAWAAEDARAYAANAKFTRESVARLLRYLPA